MRYVQIVYTCVYIYMYISIIIVKMYIIDILRSSMNNFAAIHETDFL